MLTTDDNDLVVVQTVVDLTTVHAVLEKMITIL